MRRPQANSHVRARQGRAWELGRQGVLSGFVMPRADDLLGVGLQGE